MPDLNVNVFNVNILKGKEAKKINAAPKSLNDNIVDLNTTSSREEIAKDVQGAIDSGKDVFFKTEQGVVKIPKEKVPQLLTDLRDKLKNADYNIEGFTLNKG